MDGTTGSTDKDVREQGKMPLPAQVDTLKSRSGPGDATMSPMTSVKELLADTDAAPPAPGLREAQQERKKQQYSVQFAEQPSPSTTATPPSASTGVGAGDDKDAATKDANARYKEVPPTFQQTLADLRQFLLPFLKILPFQSFQIHLKRFIGPFVRFIVRVVAQVLHKWNFGLASNLAYDLHLLLWKWVINLFFREIRPRGAYKVPRSGPVIFVCGPHHNQFLDPLLLMSEVRLSANRRVSFLVAEKSYHRKFIGLASRIAAGIPVARANDYAKAGPGGLYLPSTYSADSEEQIIKGCGTKFTSSLEPKGQLQLAKAFGFPTVEVVEVLDDETVKVKKMFSKDKAVQELLEQGKKVQSGEDGAGLKYKTLPYINQTKMYSSVYKKLSDGGCVGIFPEGGSHDRTDFLPLKHGLAIMALGAMDANPDLRVRIVPVGLNYFHPHKFRSRAVIEFGAPIDIPVSTVTTFKQGGQGKRDAIQSIMALVFDGLKSVTVRAPDYETLMVIQASRRLYKPPGQQMNLSQVVELNKRFIMGYNAYREEPRVKALYSQVEAYNKSLRQLGLKDHQVEGAGRPVWKSFLLLAYRAGIISIWTIMALPGIILNAPIFIVASIISRKKAREAVAASTVKLQGRDVLATWKVLVSLGMAPLLYGFYTAITMYLVYRYQWGRKYMLLTPFFMLIAVPSFGYSALRFGEVGMDAYKSLPPLFMSLFPWRHHQIARLQKQRSEVAAELTDTIEEFAPKLWADFEKYRILPSNADHQHTDSNRDGEDGDESTSPSMRRKSSYGPESSILQHPMTWIDEKLFGWSTSSSSARRRARTRTNDLDDASSSYPTPSASEPVTPGGYRTESDTGYDEDAADYDEVVRKVEEKLKGVSSDRTLQRKRSRSKSQLSLSELAPLDGVSTAVQHPETANTVEHRNPSTFDSSS